ncbi:MAG TPA: WecB/TagA/CpsF family glycosyltransferase [Candidatus Ornithomonoglobus merdipullorum]|uniref:N-acetylglucosaminyldiphosphoundecaprenol N-acetyl-beta-D-mannosaminyltransferase n=1 Tax=Candidatus Ornithomonoglobus merdipullorum TaxID=2840895 RepID=A0A9D1MCT6_9FIRM|nr:WecB/TagA/CpsF family glycosyltransferase [Candidatus Ornithomonoglobus merdipullorum]
MDNKVNILGVHVDMVNIPEAADRIIGFLGEKGLHKVYTPNSEIIMAAYKDEAFRNLLNNAELLTADGIGVVYASKILGKPINERAAGYDIACRVLERIAGTEHKLFLFGGKPGVAEKAEAELLKTYPGLKIVGCRNGYFKPEDEPAIVKEINDSGADIVFVCLGAPKQEQWISRHADELSARVAMGIGGSLDVFAGTAERAPKFFCDHGIEWLYRLAKQPSRAGRMLALPKFGMTVLLKGRKYKQD